MSTLSGMSRLEVLNETAIDALKPPEWLIEGILPAGGLLVLFGPPGRGKTFLALDWGFCVATGKVWLDRLSKPGAVWYVAGEGLYDLKQRKAAWQEDREVKSIPHFYAARGDINIAERAFMEDLAAAIREVDEKPSLVIFDTLARCCTAVDENSVKDLGGVIHQCDWLRQELGVAVLLLHHTTKDEGQERGSSCLKGAADTMIKLNGENDRLMMTCEKQRAWRAFDSQAFRLDEVAESCVLVPASAKVGELDFRDTQFFISAGRLILLPEGLPIKDASALWCEMTGKKDRAYREHQSAWKELGLVDKASYRLYGTNKLREMFPE